MTHNCFSGAAYWSELTFQCWCSCTSASFVELLSVLDKLVLVLVVAADATDLELIYNGDICIILSCNHCMMVVKASSSPTCANSRGSTCKAYWPSSDCP